MKTFKLIGLLSLILLCNSCITTTAVITYGNIKEHKKDKKDKKNTTVRIVTTNEEYLVEDFKLPSSYMKTVTIKLDNGEKLKIASKDIKYIAAWYESDKSKKAVRLIYTKTKQHKSFRNPNNDQMKLNQEVWLLEYYANNKISILVEAKEYKLRPNGYIEANNSYDYYFLKTNDNLPMKITRNNWFVRESVAKYLDDCPQLAKDIADKSLKVSWYEDYQTIAERYSNCDFD